MGLMAIVAALVIGIVFLNFLASRAPDDSATPPPAVPVVPAKLGTLDDLKLDATPTDERPGWLPQEVIGVLGTHKWRHWAPVKGLAFNKDGTELVSFGYDERLRFCDAKTGIERLQIPTSSSTPFPLVRDVVYSPDSKYVATLVGSGLTIYWAETGRERAAADLVQGATAVAYSGDSKILAVAAGADVNLFTADGSRRIGGLKHSAAVTALAFKPLTNPAGYFCWCRLIPKRRVREIKLWDLSKEPVPAQPKVAFPVEPHTTRTLLFSADGSFLVTAATMQVANKWPLFVWDVKAKKEKAKLTEGHTGAIWSTALSSDGQTLISGSWDGTVRIWNLKSLREQFNLQDMAGQVFAVALTPDDKTLAVGGHDNGYRDMTFRGGGRFPCMTWPAARKRKRASRRTRAGSGPRQFRMTGRCSPWPSRTNRSSWWKRPSCGIELYSRAIRLPR